MKKTTNIELRSWSKKIEVYRNEAIIKMPRLTYVRVNLYLLKGNKNLGLLFDNHFMEFPSKKEGKGLTYASVALEGINTELTKKGFNPIKSTSVKSGDDITTLLISTLNNGCRKLTKSALKR